MKNSVLRNTLVVALVISMAGCSLFGSRMQTITIGSDPEGADVIINHERVGQTPLRYQVQRGEDVLVQISKPGYETAFRNTSRNISTLGIIDVVGGVICLLPFVGLFSNAAWEHEPASIGVVLEKKSGQSGEVNENTDLHR